MELIQYLFLPVLIILPASIIYALLIRFSSSRRKILAIISGIFGGMFFGQIFSSSMHLNNNLISATYFGMIGLGIFYGLADFQSAQKLIRLKLENFGFLLMSLFIFYLIFFDIRGMAFPFNFDFEKNYLIVWLLNFLSILVVGCIFKALSKLKK